VGRKDEYVKECFKDLPSPKDGYSIDDCKDPRYRTLLAFLVSIVYPEKPNRITVTWGNTIFSALNGGRKVNWARVITTLVIQLAAWVGKSRATPICPFLYHLYERKQQRQQRSGSGSSRTRQDKWWRRRSSSTRRSGSDRSHPEPE
jgi:hypothetical protein